jgi:hypothetical protein
MRLKDPTALAIASLLVAIGNVVGGWATPDWWEGIPLVPFTLGAGALAAAAVHLRTKSLLAALPVGVAVSVVTLIATFGVSCSRWCS